MRGERRAAEVVRAVARRVPLLDEESAYRLVLRLAARLQTLVADRPRLVRGLLWALAFWLCSAASLWVFLAAFGYRAGVDGLIVAFALAYVLAAIPVTPAGLGVVEATMIAMLTFFGADRSPHGKCACYRRQRTYIPNLVKKEQNLMVQFPGTAECLAESQRYDQA